MDLQQNFLGEQNGRMPVDRDGAAAVIRIANDILTKKVLAEALPIIVLNQFSPSDRIGNFFRKGAAIAGTAGAELDARLAGIGAAKVITKSRPSAFANPELRDYLRAQGVRELYVLGVFAEGCVRSTVIDAIKLGFSVHIVIDAVASDAAWKKRFAIPAMKRAGAKVVTGESLAGLLKPQ